MYTNLSSTSTTFVTGFCPTKRVEAIGIQRTNGTYFKYFFDHKTGKFQHLKCLECQPTVTETDLFPLYAVYSERLSKYVIFTRNWSTYKIEQYVFCPETGGFQQVNCPEIVYNQNLKITSEVICVVLPTKNHGMALIQREYNGNFRKLRYIQNLGQYVEIPKVYVKTLVMKELESSENENIDSEGVTSSLPKFISQYCPRLQTDVICVLRKNLSYSRFAFNYITGDFDSIASSDTLTEQDLYPIYVERSIQKYVIFAHNGLNSQIEKYIYNTETQGFEEVDLPEMIYTPPRDTSSENFKVEISTKDGTVFIEKDVIGCFRKTIFCSKSQKYIQIPQKPVKTMKMRKEEKSEVEVNCPEVGPNPSNPENFEEIFDFLISASVKSDTISKKTLDPLNILRLEALLVEAINGKENESEDEKDENEKKVSSLEIYLRKNNLDQLQTGAKRRMTHWKTLKVEKEEKSSSSSGNSQESSKSDKNLDQFSVQIEKSNMSNDDEKDQNSSSISICSTQNSCETWGDFDGEWFVQKEELQSDCGSDISILTDNESDDGWENYQ